jgi:hypothetical protein
MSVFKVLALAVTAIAVALIGGTVLAAKPSTSNYSLQSYGFGSGGTGGSSTSNYSLEGISGELSGQSATTTNYALKPGYIQTQQANVPKVTLTNPSNYYDKLEFVIDTQGNPGDALYALQVKVNDATCDFTTGTIMYVKSDDTLTSTLTTAEYHTYTFWGAGGGANIIGLSPSTNYCMRAKATQGQYTESAYGPSSSAATVGQQISFCLYSNAGNTCAEGGSTAAFGSIPVNTITSAQYGIGLNFSTNANNGGNIYLYDTNGGLKSTSASNYLIGLTLAQQDLAAVSEGYGAQISSSSGLSGNPNFTGSGNTVGKITPTIQTLLDSSTPVTNGSASVALKAKTSSTTPAATDYGDLVTFIAAANF